MKMVQNNPKLQKFYKKIAKGDAIALITILSELFFKYSKLFYEENKFNFK